MLPLPVDAHIERARSLLNDHRALVVIAAPGAGKTTRVPPALVDRGRVLLLQPRRVAARAMARRIAAERNWTIGREIGWHIRFERQFTNETRVLVVTEGILTAYVQQDPLLSDVATVVIDEFHERSVHADLGLALAKQAWLARTDLRIVVMSATLDPEPVSRFLGGCEIIEVPGSLHPLTAEYAPGESVADALGNLLPRTTGNVLCFLPGAREIQAAIAESQAIARQHDVELVPLHGSLDSAAQDAALSMNEPASAKHLGVKAGRRVIVATNIAETSLTVSGVTTVIDTGLQKVARYDEARAIDSLTTERITIDSADQRAGRAARLGPGIARRLWDPRDRLRPHREPDIHRVDLTGLLLSVLAWGSRPDSFEWFDPPSPDRIAAAMSLLQQLGAIDDRGLTDIGRQMQRLPLSPRLARVLLAAHGSFEGCAACARLSEPAAADHRLVEQNLSNAAKNVVGARYRAHVSDTELRRALLAGYPDRVAKRRDRETVTMASGHGAVIAKDSGAEGAEWMIALDVTSGRKTATTQALLRLASAIEREWLSPTRSTIEQRLNESGSVSTLEIDWYGELVLVERQRPATLDMTAAVLAAAWMERGPDKQTARLLQRLKFGGIELDVSDLVFAAAVNARRVQDIVISEDTLPWDVRKRLAAAAPGTLKVPSGRDMTINYEADGTLSVSVKLQELFGLGETPRIGPSRTPITFHLLAPNGRPVQTTQDLKSFWERTYPEVRKELRGRYPKHPWPEDPWNAPPTHRTTRRRD
ncbi:MAG: DEAD/DEAH box helicase [Cyanobacteria bacterium]|nr:DEAD/DEAH box helicase [Cyanobacteriota bacterium]